MDCSSQVSLSITNSWSLLKFMSIELVIPSNHLILCRLLLLLPSIFPIFKVFSTESVLCMRWPKYWSISISPSNELFRTDFSYFIDMHLTLVKSVLVAQQCLTLCNPTDYRPSFQAPLSIGFSRQEHWSGLPFSSPGDLPDPGIEARSPSFQGDTLRSELSGKPLPSLVGPNCILFVFFVSTAPQKVLRFR